MNNRLTTDNPQSNFETMMNFAYSKDRRVVLRFGLGQEDIDLCDYIAKASQNNCNITPEEVMEGACFECDNGYCTLGIFYAVATQAAELRTRLKEYEDREEQRVGEWIYGRFDNARCSECGYETTHDGISPYCPICGALMEDEEDG